MRSLLLPFLAACFALPAFAADIAFTADGQSRFRPADMADKLKNPWPDEMEKGFWKRADVSIQAYKGKGYGNTFFENEKRAYALAMMDFLAGNRENAVKFLQSEDADAGRWHQHTEGIDLFPSFTVKGQMRKYFYFGQFLDAKYRARMKKAFGNLTEKDPLRRPHAAFKGGGEGWTPEVKNSWVDVRNTDNLRFMRDTSVYLMAGESGNKEVRDLYKQRLTEHVRAMYDIGMGEWDSENYLGHSFEPWLNLYDFAQDEQVKLLAKGALDWISAAAAVKYFHGGFNGPSKRDYYHMAPFKAAAGVFALYFGDSTVEPDPDYDHVYLITSNYRPPQAVVELARKNFKKPVELQLSHPTYEHFHEGKGNEPEFFEFQYIANSYQLGSLPTGTTGDTNGLKLIAYNSKRGIDYFVPASGDAATKITTSTNGKDHVAQNRSLLLFLNGDGKAPYHLFLPVDAKREETGGVTFFELERTWIALHPINLAVKGINAEATKVVQEKQKYPEAHIFAAQGTGGKYSGFAMEVGEKESFGSYAAFRKEVLAKAKLDVEKLVDGLAEFTGANGDSVRIQVKPEGLPTVWRNGTEHDWKAHWAPYQPTDGDDAPIRQEWKSGQFRVEAGGHTFEGKLDDAGNYTFSNN